MKHKTQGNKKIIQLLEDMDRNHIFLSKLIEAFEIMKNDPKGKKELYYEKVLERLTNEYETFYLKANKQLNSLLSPADKIFDDISREYKIDSDTLMAFLMPKFTGRNNIDNADTLDMCIPEDRYTTDICASKTIPVPAILDPVKESMIMSYPVSLNIHRFATKRDVLDYIEKNWKSIEDIMVRYEPNKKIIRKRKYNKKFYDFIWENRNKKTEEIIRILYDKFPEYESEYFTYVEIYQLIRQERNRRTRKIV